MTKRDRKALGEYIRDMADKLGLRDWHLILSGEDFDADEDGDLNGALAHVNATEGRKGGYICVRKGFRDLDREEIRYIICHELLHCHLAALQSQCENDLGDLIGRPAEAAFNRSFRRNLEYGVDGIAEALARHLPLIEWR